MKIFRILPLFLFSACAPHLGYTTYNAPSALPLTKAVTTETQTIAKAKMQVVNLSKLSTPVQAKDIAQLQLTLDTATTNAADTQTALEDLTKADAAAMDKANSEIKNVAGQRDSAVAAVAAQAPKHKRDLEWLIGAGILGAAFCFAGPFLRAAWAPLMIVPSFIAGPVCAVAGLGIFYGLVGLLSLFGYL